MRVVACKPGRVADDDLRTDTFSNARGWTAVRVTHPASGIVAERVRSPLLTSAVEAQRECVAEVRRQLDGGLPPEPAVPVTRAELDALEARVRRVEERLDER